jgi:flavodoxin
VRALVIFYSRTGRTARVAGLLADGLHSEGLEVTVAQMKTRTGQGIISCIRQVMTSANPALALPVPDTKVYDLVFLGFPVWANRPASPVNSILSEIKDAPGPKFALFVSSGSKEGHRAAVHTVSNRLTEMGYEVVAARGFPRGQRLPETVRAASEFVREVVARISP